MGYSDDFRHGCVKFHQKITLAYFSKNNPWAKFQTNWILGYLNNYGLISRHTSINCVNNCTFIFTRHQPCLFLKALLVLRLPSCSCDCVRIPGELWLLIRPNLHLKFSYRFPSCTNYGGSLRTWCELFLFRFSEILSRFRKIVFHFRKIVFRFRLFRESEILSRESEIISRFRRFSPAFFTGVFHRRFSPAFFTGVFHRRFSLLFPTFRHFSPLLAK